MNICFYTGKEVSPEIGGTERITASVASGLTKFYGFKCFSLYSLSIAEALSKYRLESKLKIRSSNKGYKDLVDY